ncbi:uncharacterized protein [Hyperolius riggenbachi]
MEAENNREILPNSEGTIIEEISGDNFIIQISEMSMPQGSAQNGVASHPQKTSGFHHSAETPVTPHKPKVSTNQKTFFAPIRETVEVPGGLIHTSAKSATILENAGRPLIPHMCGAGDTAGDRLITQDTKVSYVQSLSGPQVDGNYIKTESVCYLDDEANISCGPVSVLCNPAEVLLIGSGEQTESSTVFSDNEFLTVIQVEEINVALEREARPVHTDVWEAQSGNNNVAWNGKEEAWNQQEETVFPLALMVPHNSAAPQYSWIEDQKTLKLATSQWPEPAQATDCKQVGGRPNWGATPACPAPESVKWVDKGERETPVIERSFKCPVCSKRFLYKHHLRSHEKQHVQDKLFKCPKCDLYFSSHQNLLQHQNTKHNVTHNGSVVATDSSEQPSKVLRCPDCGRTFSGLFQLNRHQKFHAQEKTLSRPVAPPPKKVYKLPQFQLSGDKTMEKTETRMDSLGDSCKKLHQHLQLSTAFLQKLLTSTCGFQYD